MSVNVSLTIDGAEDGTTNTLMLTELRVGLTEKDRRGTWAMGVPGASSVFYHGWEGDASGVNSCAARPDDIRGCEYHSQLNAENCMSCYLFAGNSQAGTRSAHRGGVHAAFMDCSVHFLSDYIEHSGFKGECCSVWDHLILSSDGNILEFDKLGF